MTEELDLCNPMTSEESNDPVPGLEPHPTRPWQETAVLAQARRARSLAQVNPPEVPDDLPLNVTGIPAQVLTPREIEITSQTPEDLLQYLRTGEWSSFEVTSAFLRRAAVAQKLVNCITDLLPERALARAKELDEHLRITGKPLGPLHGLPISVKEHVAMKGLDMNAGYCTFYGRISAEDALILQILRNAGAVFHARTMQPQTTMHLETSNNLYGVTVNPYNRRLTSGGSSGGEGALIALGGSVLGIGTDIGGSIRSPAANCGLFGFKGTSGRLPFKDLDAEGFDHISTVVGPLSSSFEGIKTLMKTVIDARPRLKEPSCVPLPWRVAESRLPRKLKVGVLWDDGVVKPHPPVLRALRETVEKLKKAGDVELVEWDPYKHDLAWEIIASLYFPDSAADERRAIAASGEPWRPLSDFIINQNSYVKPEGLSIPELWEATARRERCRREYIEHWNKTATQFDAQGIPVDAVDVIMSPVGPGVAPPLDCARYWGYTALWNLLDYPCLVFPVSGISRYAKLVRTNVIRYPRSTCRWTSKTARMSLETLRTSPTASFVRRVLRYECSTDVF